MTALKAGLAFVLLTTPCAAGPAWNTAAPEKTFTFRGAPIHPGCLDSMESREGDVIDLKTCTTEAKKAYFVPKFEKGNYTADGRDKEEMHPVFASYSVLANLGDVFLIQTQSSGGGTGIFDMLEIVQRDADSVRIKKYVSGGDRCVGGLASAHVKGDKILYSTDITPYYVIAEPTETLKGVYEKLDSSAISCVATNDMEWDLSTGKEKRLSMTLTGDWYTGNGAAGQPLEGGDGINACFNRFYNSYFLSKKTRLDPATLAAFRKTFFATCKK